VEIAHGLGRRVASHSEGEAGIRVALEAGIDTIEHGNHLTPELAQQMVAQNRFLVPTVGAFRNSVGRTDINPQYVLTSIELAEASETALQVAREHKVKVACGTDRGTAMQMPWTSDYLVDEVKYLVELGGFSPIAAIRSATGVGAEALDVDKITGSLAKGKKADLLAVAGNVLANLDALRTPVLVLKEGVPIVGPEAEPAAPAVLM
jgi:imidazolonepropionase-like amidohydrolase